MLIVPPVKYRKSRREVVPPLPPGPPVLALVSAVFNADDPSVYLVFSRAIDISGIDITQFNVLDGEFTQTRYDGQQVDSVDGASILIGLVDGGGYGSDAVQLFISPENGIVAADDQSPFEGADYLPLPFPS